ncbi:uncharacterized protein [Littorina saxatilis]
MSSPKCASSLTSSERHRMTQLESSVYVLTQQLMMTQLAQEEMRRSDGDSGIKQVRLNRDGTRPYHCNTHTGPSIASIHDHANMPNTCGMGEIEAVLNGVHFRTRHNDYLLRMSLSNRQYHGTAAVPFPAVPPPVLKKKSIGDQVIEMREWFRAWKDGDFSKRDYRPYFKPVLCYLEGAWTTDVTLDEPFHSERHRVDASDLKDLHDKIRFTAHTGDKNVEENLAYLPSMILNITDGVPSIAQWNYRILCHPIKQDLKLKDLKPVDDLGVRLANKDLWEDYVMSRAARFSLNPFGGEKIHKWTPLDKIMKQIPGKNGYGSRLTDKSIGGMKLNGHNNRPLNTAFYHRWYKLGQAGAMGDKVAHTGFADRNLFVAETTQPRVAPMSVKSCRASAGGGRKVCMTHTRRVSYAVPLEVVYLTPLHSWNPYNLLYKGDKKSPLGRTVLAGGRNGKLTSEGAYNGTNSRHFYHTPAQFFRSGNEVNSDPADTVKGVVGVLDPNGKVRSVVASGVRIFLPEIKGVGVLRTRYPVMPVYAEGSTIWKELEALRDVVMNMQEHQKYFRNTPSFLTGENAEGSEKKQTTDTSGNVRFGTNQNESSHKQALPKNVYLPATNLQPGKNSNQLTTSKSQFSDYMPPSHVTLVTSPSATRSYVTMHVHTVDLNRAQLYSMVKLGKRVTLRTTLDGGHSHLLAIGFDKKTQYFYLHRCDGRAKCWDGHSNNLEKIQSNSVPSLSENLRRYG